MPRLASTFVAAIVVVLFATIDRPIARAQQYYRPIPEEYYRGPRLRLNAEGEIGGGGAGGGLGLGGGATIGVGLQVNDIIAGFVQHRVLLGDRMDAPDAGLFAHVYHSFLLDLTLFESVQIGAGPSLDFGFGSLCAPGQEALGACGSPTGPYVGMDVRLALSLGQRSLARRRGLVIVAHLHPTWPDRSSAVVTATLGAGFELD